MRKLVCTFAFFVITIAISCIVLTGCSSPMEPEPLPPLLVTYTVTFDSNGGSPVSAQTVQSGLKAVIPEAPQKENWYFAGWLKADGSVYNFSAPVTADTTLTAKWQVIVTFNANGGTLKNPTSATTKTVYADINAPFVAPELQRSSAGKVYGVLGWSKKSDTTESTYDTDRFDLSIGSETSPVMLYAVWTESSLYTVQFNTNGSGSSFSPVSVKQGEPVNRPASNPVLTSHYFRFWSEDQETAYDFSTPITEDITLYALWVPQIYELRTLSNDSLVVDCYSSSPKLSNGCITATYTTATNSTPKPLPLTYVSQSTRYVTYSFPAFSSEIAETYTVSITNGRETESKTLTVTLPAPVSALSAEADDSKITLSWTNPEGYSYVDIECKTGNTVVYSKVNIIGTSETLYGLANGTEYTFKVTTAGTDKSASIKATPSVTKKTSDWLYIMYMDGDNNLNDPIFLDLNEIEYGLYNIRNTDGSAKSGYGSVNVVALWDGFAGDSQTRPQIGKKGSYLYELGTDYSNAIQYIDSRGCVLSSDTKNLSYTAPDWLLSGQTVANINTSSGGEVNMGSQQTLINFLNWAKERYDATNIVLQFSNHGGGPRSAPTTVTLEDGRTVRLNTDYGRKALCWDDNSGVNAFLKTKDVSEALTAAGYGSANKLGMILMDVCLGASIEDAYQFKDFAYYYAASPNNVPGMGMDYVAMMKSCTSSSTLESVGKQMVTDYKKQYEWKPEVWAKLISVVELAGGVTLENLEKVMWLSDAGISTFSFIDLTKINDVKSAIDQLATLLLDNKEKNFSYTDKDGNPVTVPYITALKNHAQFFSPYLDDTLYYIGSFTWLFDVGYIATNMVRLSATIDKDGKMNTNIWPELEMKSNAVLAALSSAVVSSWRDAPRTGGLYPVLNKTSNPFGLTICGETIVKNGDILQPGNAPSFYKTDLAFGRDSTWSDLLIEWFGN